MNNSAIRLNRFKIVISILALSFISINNFSQSYDSKFVNQSIPDRMTPGQKYNLILTFQNSGSESWTPGTVRLRFLPYDDTKAVWSQSELELTKTIEPGNTATFEVGVTAPSSEGVYKLSAQLVNSGNYFGEPSKQLDISVNRGTSVGDVLNSAAFVEQTVPQEMQAGRSYKVMVSYTNTGKTTWSTGNYRLVLLDAAGNPLTGSMWSNYSVGLDENITPGGSKVFNFDIIPFSAGTYTLQWRMASSDGGLFGDVSNPVVVTVNPVPDDKNKGRSGKE